MKLKPVYILSIVISILTLGASLGGLLIDNLYRDKTNFALSAWYGNDLVTLTVALPLFLVAFIFTVKGSKRAQLIWLGMVDFIIYNYAFYLFGAAFNWFFPVYVALFTLAAYTLVFGMIDVDISSIKHGITDRCSFRRVSIYMFLWASILGFAWMGQWVNFVLTGILPQIVVETGASNNLVAGLDLTFVVPMVLLSGIWLWQHRPWGYVLAVMCNVKGTLYTIVLMVGSLIQAKSGVKGALDLEYLWIFLCLGCLLSSMYLLKRNPLLIPKD